MSERDEALSLLRERFPEPWVLSLRSGAGNALRWFAEADLRSDNTPTDAVRVSGFGQTPHMAVCALFAAWDEASKPQAYKVTATMCVYCGESLLHRLAPGPDGIKAIHAVMCEHDQHCERNPLVAALAAERAHADELAAAIRSVMVVGITEACLDHAIAAHDARRGK